MLNSPWSVLKKKWLLGAKFLSWLTPKVSWVLSNKFCVFECSIRVCMYMFECTHTCVYLWVEVLFLSHVPLDFFPFFHSLIVSYLWIINFSHFFPTYFCQALHLLLNAFPFPTSLPLMLMSSFSVGSTEHNYSRLHKHGPEVICWSMATLLFQPGSVTEPGPYQLTRLSSSKLQGSNCPHSLTFPFSVLGFTNSCFCTQLFM